MRRGGGREAAWMGRKGGTELGRAHGWRGRAREGEWVGMERRGRGRERGREDE